jgi:hypothetical protein
MHPKNKVVVKKSSYRGRFRPRVLITPVDKKGNLLGPELVGEFLLLITLIGDFKIESKFDLDGRGSDEITVNWEKEREKRGLICPKNAIRVQL